MKVLVPALIALAFATLAAGAVAEPVRLQGGSYEVAFRLELPHLERWALTRTATICVTEAERLPFKVLSENHPFAKCYPRNIERRGAELHYSLACAGRDAARAEASYAIAPGGFSGRIAMVMGAKNMTMVEVQTGRRIGSCDLARMRQD
jgi:hypothetical protein